MRRRSQALRPALFTKFSAYPREAHQANLHITNLPHACGYAPSTAEVGKEMDMSERIEQLGADHTRPWREHATAPLRAAAAAASRRSFSFRDKANRIRKQGRRGEVVARGGPDLD